MGPEAKFIGLPVVKYVAKVPPTAGWTMLVAGGLNVMVVGVPVTVKESPPKAAKKPLMESACATEATLLKARAKSVRRRVLIWGFS